MSNVPLEVSPRDYHEKLVVNRENIFAEDSYLSKSVLFQLKKCSLHRWRYAPPVFSPTKFSEWGSVLDCMVTTPDELDDLVAIHDFDSFRTKEAQEFKSHAISNGLIIMNRFQMEEAEKACEALMRNKDSEGIISNSKKQVVLISKVGREDPVNFKGLVDLAPDDSDYLSDLKTTPLFTPDGLSKTIADRGYHVQAFLYLLLWNKLFPDDQRTKFRHIWQDQNPPYEVAVTELAKVDIDAGGEYAKHLLGKLTRAAKEDRWPNIFDDKIPILARPVYASIKEDEEIDGVYEAPKPK